jgi:hypothetical protein
MQGYEMGPGPEGMYPMMPPPRGAYANMQGVPYFGRPMMPQPAYPGGPPVMPMAPQFMPTQGQVPYPDVSEAGVCLC